MNQEKQGKYESLREQYPEYISLDQLYRICGIAKRSAKYLVDHGIIPYQDTGKQTWRYKIALDDAIVYLRRREQVGSMIPVGSVTSRTEQIRSMNKRKGFTNLIQPGMESDIAEYFRFIFSDADDVLTVNDVADMIGFEKSTVRKLLKSGEFKSITAHPKYLIPKQYLLDFVTTPKFIGYRSESEQFKKIIRGFEIWTNAKS